MGLAVVLLLIPGWRYAMLVARIFSNIRRLRLILKPVQAYSDVSTRFVVRAPTWLEQILQYDKEHLSECFKLLGIGWNYSPSSEPYIEALANMENNAVFPLKVVGITGCIYINALRCNLPITIDREYEFPRLHHEVVRIRQAINPDTAKMITEFKDKKEPFHINLSQCFLTTQILEPEHGPQIVKISIGTQFGVSHITKM